jgi:hypothetical protein
LFILIIGQKVSLGKTARDAIAYFPKDTVSLCPMTYNSKSFEYFKGKNIYNYSVSPIEGHRSLWEIIKETIRRFLETFFSEEVTESQIRTTLWIITVIVVVMIVLFLFFFKPSFLFRDKKQTVSFSVEDENIHRLNFSDLLKDALLQERYADAIRWEYLRLLKRLDERRIIVWDPHKTVVEYANAVKKTEIKAEFYNISRQFLYYRYGNFEASKEEWNFFVSSVNKIINRI